MTRDEALDYLNISGDNNHYDDYLEGWADWSIDSDGLFTLEFVPVDEHGNAGEKQIFHWIMVSVE